MLYALKEFSTIYAFGVKKAKMISWTFLIKTTSLVFITCQKYKHIRPLYVIRNMSLYQYTRYNTLTCIASTSIGLSIFQTPENNLSY